jgi:hypothetical protein
MKVKYLGKVDTIALEKDKVYDVLSIEKGWYRIMTELDEDYLFPPEQFEITEEGDLMTEEAYKYILSRILERAFESIEDAKESNSDFGNGRKLAYYEVADIIKSELWVRDADLKEFGLDIDLEKTFL